MFEFIQAQTSGIIFLFVLSIAAPIAGAVLLTTRMIVKRHPGIPFSAIVPAVLSTGLITSLLLGFVFQRAWESFDVASKSLNQEVIHLGWLRSRLRSCLLPPTKGSESGSNSSCRHCRRRQPHDRTGSARVML